MCHVTNKATSGLILKASADREKRSFINVLFSSFTTYQRTVPSVTEIVVKPCWKSL